MITAGAKSETKKKTSGTVNNQRVQNPQAHATEEDVIEEMEDTTGIYFAVGAQPKNFLGHQQKFTTFGFSSPKLRLAL